MSVQGFDNTRGPSRAVANAAIPQLAFVGRSPAGIAAMWGNNVQTYASAEYGYSVLLRVH